MKISSIIVTFFVTGAAGAIAGSIFAARKGTKIRSRISKKGREYKDYILDSYNNFADTVTHPFEDLEDETIRVSKKAIQNAEKIKAIAHQ